MLAEKVALQSRDAQLRRAGPEKSTGAADRAADRESQMTRAPPRNPGLSGFSLDGPARTAASHMAKGTFHEHKCPFLSEALQQR